MVSQVNLSTADYKHITRLITEVSTNFKHGSDKLQQLLSELFGYHSSIFWKVDPKGNLSDPINYRISDYLVKDYLDCFHSQDYLHAKKQLHLYQKQVALRLEDVISIESYERSDYYREFMKKHGQYHEMGILFYSRNKINGALGISRPFSQKGFTEVDRTIFRTVAPILSNLLYLEREYEEQRKEKNIFEAFAARNTTGFILLDQKYDVIYMNQAVLDIYRKTAIHKNIESFVKDITLAISNRSAGSPLLMSRGYNIQVIAHQELFLSREGRYAVIIERDKDEAPLDDEKMLNGLTKREKEICFYLKKGCTYQEISDKLCISIYTVNKHVKNIYQKTGVNSRGSLLAKLLYYHDGTN